MVAARLPTPLVYTADHRNELVRVSVGVVRAEHCKAFARVPGSAVRVDHRKAVVTVSRKCCESRTQKGAGGSCRDLVRVEHRKAL